MYELLEATKEQLNPQATVCEHNKIEVLMITPQLTGTLKSLYWNIITLGKAKVYAVRDNTGRVIHSSYVISKCYKFPFLRRGYHDIEIGPCVKDSEHRGKGLYPYVLTDILSRELGEDDKAYMIVDSDNTPSIRGAVKTGFIRTMEIKKDGLKRYVIVKRLEIL
jgi:hypothetical protein